MQILTVMIYSTVPFSVSAQTLMFVTEKLYYSSKTLTWVFKILDCEPHFDCDLKKDSYIHVIAKFGAYMTLSLTELKTSSCMDLSGPPDLTHSL